MLAGGLVGCFNHSLVNKEQETKGAQDNNPGPTANDSEVGDSDQSVVEVEFVFRT